MELEELGTVCDLQNGYAFKSKDYVEKSNTVSLRMSNIRPGGNFDNNYNLRYLPDDYQEKFSNYKVFEGDLVIAMTDLANDPKILGIPTIVETGEVNWLLNQRAGKLIVKDETKANKNYLRYILNHPIHRNYYKMFAGGGLQINVGKKEILGCKIPLPTLETQKQIAQILDKAADLRDKTKQLLAEYDQLAQSIFLEMFGDPVTNPKGWEVKTMRELTKKIMSGNTPKGGSKVYVTDGILFFRSQNVWKNRIELDNIAFIDLQTHSKMKKSSLKYGDILMTKTGRVNTENSSLGRAAMYLGEDDKANINGHVYLIRPKKSIVKEYVLFILTTIQYRDYIRRTCVGGIDKRQINKNHIEDFPIIYPPIIQQNQFAEKIALIEQQKDLAKQELQESEDLFQALLQKAFKGKLEV